MPMQYEDGLFDYILFRMEEQGTDFLAPDGDRVLFEDAQVMLNEATFQCEAR